MVMTTGNPDLAFHLCILYPSNCASCALMIESNLFFLRNLLAASDPKKNDHPLTSFVLYRLSQYPLSSSTGSDHRISQKRPVLGGSLARLMLLRSSSVFRSGEIPPWMARNLLFTNHPIGRTSKLSMNKLYVSSSYLVSTSILKLKNPVICLHS